MKNPYSEFKRHPEWNVIKNALNDLVANQDIKITTVDNYVVGYLMSKIVTATPIIVDWTSCDTVDAFYDLVLPQCGSPCWHGRNLNALNDSWITGGIDTEGPPYAFYFINSPHPPTELKEFQDAVERIAGDSVSQNGGQIHKKQNKS